MKEALDATKADVKETLKARKSDAKEAIAAGKTTAKHSMDKARRKSEADINKEGHVAHLLTSYAASVAVASTEVLVSTSSLADNVASASASTSPSASICESSSIETFYVPGSSAITPTPTSTSYPSSPYFHFRGSTPSQAKGDGIQEERRAFSAAEAEKESARKTYNSSERHSADESAHECRLAGMVKKIHDGKTVEMVKKIHDGKAEVLEKIEDGKHRCGRGMIYAEWRSLHRLLIYYLANKYINIWKEALTLEE